MEISNIRLVISQPLSRSKPSETDFPVADLDNEVKFLKARAFHTMQVWKTEKPAAYYHHQHPGEKQCTYCKAKVDCQKYKETVSETVFSNKDALAGFDVLDLTGEEPKPYFPIEPHLMASYFLRVPLIRAWCDAIEAKVFVAVKNGQITEKHGLKMVAGRKGARAWDNPAEVEEMFKSMKLTKDEMYSYTLITPTKAEQLLKDNPRKWAKAQKRITQSEGGPKVVHVSDKKPAISTGPNADGMEESPPPAVETATADSGDDLL